MLTPNWRATAPGLTPASSAARMAFTFEVGIDAAPDSPADADEGFERK